MSNRRVIMTGGVGNTNESVRPGKDAVHPERFPHGTQELVPMRDANLRLVEDDIAEIAHDLKTPLGAIALDAGLLVERLRNAEHDGGLRSVSRIQQNVAYMDRLVLDLLDACAIVRGELSLDRSPTEMSALLERVVDRVVGTARLRLFIDARERLVVHVDQHRIERVVANLIDNALKYAPTSTGIVLRLAYDATSVCVSVIDAGPGIAPDEVPHVFDRSRRASSSNGNAGYGLGLYVSKQIVEAHGGSIGVHSVRGEGSRFFFALPR